MADLDQSTSQKSTFPSYCWKMNTWLAKCFLLFFLQKQHDQMNVFKKLSRDKNHFKK